MLAASTILVLASFSAVNTPQLYEFSADWCPACRGVEPVVTQLKARGVPIQRVDVDKRPEWAKQARVRSLPCFIAVANGREVGRLEGAATPRELSRLYLQAVQHSTRAGASHNANENSKRGAVNKDGPDVEMVRGQTPSRPSPGKRLGQALNNLAERSKEQKCRCNGQCSCTPAEDSRVATAGPAAYPGRPVGYATAEPNLDRATAPQRALEATVRIKIVDEIGQSYGTGTIIDVHEDEALVLTCGHIFRDSDGKGRIFCDSFAPGAKPGIEGKLVSYDVRRDVGLISFRPGVSVTAATLGGTGHRPSEGDAVFCIGCNHGADPTIIDNKIIAVNRYHGPPNLVVGGRPVDGRSGGGLFTREGLLIGVCNAADREYDEGLYAALGNVHAELDAVGLGYIYRGQQPAIARRDSRTPRPAATDQDYRPRAETMPVSMPTTDRIPPANSAPLPAANPQSRRADSAGTSDSFTSVEQRTIVKEQELICIMRSLDDPQPKSVFVLDRPSQSLLDQLAAEANRRGPHRDTRMHVDNTARGGTAPRVAAQSQLGGNPTPRGNEGDWRSLVPTNSL